MKTFPVMHRCFRRLAVVLALSVSFAAVPGFAPTAVAAEEKKEPAGFVEKMKQWQEQMTDRFRDTWQDLWSRKDAKANKSAPTAAVDLREQQDGYTIRLHLPGRNVEKGEVALEDGALRIAAPAEENVSRYEQTIILGGVEVGAKPQIKRRPNDHLIVVQVPKTSTPIAHTESRAKAPLTDAAPFGDWDRDVLARMERMRQEMDRILEDSFREFRLQPGHERFFDEPRFGSSLDVQEEGNNYVVRAYLPDRDMNNVNVTVEGQTLRIEAKAEESERKDEGKSTIIRNAQYAQLLTLPGAVQSDKMQVDRKDGVLVITLPKA